MVARVVKIGAVLASVLAAACGGRTSPPPTTATTTSGARLPDGPPLLTPGETMSYRLSLEGVDLATYDVAVGPVTVLDNHRVVTVQSHAKTRGLAAVVKTVDDTFTSWVDVETGRPRRWAVDEATPDGSARERTDAHFDQRANDTLPVSVTVNDQPLAESQKVTLADVWDYNSYLIALRAWEAPKGTTIVSEVFRSRYMWHITMTIAGKEKLVTELGEFPTLRFDGRGYRLNRNGTRDTSFDERAFSIWITDDSGRVPVLSKARTDYGDIELEIVDYQPGTGERLRP